jgi:hypothetical protein
MTGRTVRGELWYSEINKEAEDLYLQFAQKAEAAGKPIIVFLVATFQMKKFASKMPLFFAILIIDLGKNRIILYGLPFAKI